MALSKSLVAAALVLAFSNAYAQGAAPAAASTAGTLVVVPAYGEVTHANDQAIVTFAIEEFDKDKEKAADRVNRKMKEGTEIVRRADPGAQLKTRGYYTYPVYAEPQPGLRTEEVKPVLTGWRVGQYLEAKTTNLAALPKTAAAAQKVLQINGVNFGLAPATQKKLDDERIAATYRNLHERVASIARAMGRQPSEAVLDLVDFEGSGNYGNEGAQNVSVMASRGFMAAKADVAVAEPSFEPGETTLQMRLVGKVRFK